MKQLRYWLLAALAAALPFSAPLAQTYQGPNSGAGAAAVIPGYQNGTNAYGYPIVQPVSPATPLPVGVSGAVSNSVGAAALNTNSVSVSSTATLIVAARTGAAGTGRVAVTIVNKGTAEIDLGNSSSVTTSTGFPLQPGAFITWNYTGPVYGIVATGTQTAGYSETY